MVSLYKNLSSLVDPEITIDTFIFITYLFLVWSLILICVSNFAIWFFFFFFSFNVFPFILVLRLKLHFSKLPSFILYFIF